MRRSFIFMLGACGMALIVILTMSSPPLIIAASVIAVSLAGLWLSHLTAFALRAVGNASTLKDDALRASIPTDLAPQLRRQFIFGFAKSFILVATVTALPIQAVLAQTRMHQS
jgi:hypothetical protein